MQSCRITTELDYWERVRSSDDEFFAFVDELLVPESWFFRDRIPFDYLRHWVQQYWLPGPTKEGVQLRILSLPCATGQEPYSVAISLLEAGMPMDGFSVLAGDLSQRLLDQAQEGIYRRISFRGDNYVPLENYFDSVNDSCLQVKPAIRTKVEFSRMNLMEPSSFCVRGPFHIIFCRNVLIYFGDDSRKLAFDGITSVLAPEGLFFAGHADAIFRISNDYERVGSPGAFCFQKKTVEAASPSRIPNPQLTSPPRNKSTAKKRGRVFSRNGLIPEEVLEQATMQSSLVDAQRLANCGDLKEAEQICRRSIDVEGSTSCNCFLLGEILFAQKRLADADSQYRRAVYLDRYHRDALFRLAQLAQQRGDEREAANWKRRAAKISPSNIEAVT